MVVGLSQDHGAKQGANWHVPLKSYLDLYKHLPQTNCKKCGMAACLAFAAAAMRGQKLLSACPDLAPRCAKNWPESWARLPTPRKS